MCDKCDKRNKRDKCDVCNAAGPLVSGSDTSIEARCNIRDIEPSTSSIPRNVYHLHTPLFVMDAIRLFQDHPKFPKGLHEHNLVEILSKEPFACGDLNTQVKMALKELTDSGFVRYTQKGYRTLGPFARLSMARNARQYNATWERISELQNVSSTSLESSSSSSLRKSSC